MFLESLESLFSVAVVGIVTYIALIIMLRVSGKRTLSKMNMFDFITTVALGSIFGTVVVSNEVPPVRGVVAAGTLIIGQYVVTRLSTQSEWFRDLVKGQPTLLYYDGRYLTQQMHSSRVTKEDIYQAMRKFGLLEMQEAFAVVLETDGSITAIPATEGRPDSLRYSSSLQNLSLDDVLEQHEKNAE